jgi:hypothetical protein
MQSIITNKKTIELLGLFEYQHLFNYGFRNGSHFGFETKFIEMFAIRCGYYYENIDDNNSSANEDQLSEFTYGFGVDIPIYDFIDIPIRLQIDYTSLEQPNYSTYDSDWDNFNSITFKLSWYKR